MERVNEIGNKIQEYRISAGLTQEELSERAGISCNYLSALERGVKTPALNTFVNIINVIGISADDVLEDVLDVNIHHGYTEREKRIQRLSLKKQNKIYRVMDVLIEEEEKS